MHQPIAIFALVALPILGYVTFLCSPLALHPTLAKSSTSTDSKPLTTSKAPTCLDLSKVQGSVIEFGGKGKVPYKIAIQSNGQISTNATPAVYPPTPYYRLKTQRLSPTTVKALVQLANAQSFWTLPKEIGQKNSSRDRSIFVTFNLACASHSVVFLDGSQTDPNVQRFAEMYALLSDLVSGDSIGYKPVE